jgi:hypothetical protein
MRRVLQFVQEFGSVAFFVAASVASIFGFLVSVANQYEWGIYGSFVTVVVTSVIFCWQSFSRNESLQCDLRAEKDRTANESRLRQEAELSLASVPLRAIEDISSMVTAGARTRWIQQLVQTLRLAARMSHIARQGNTFSVATATDDHQNLYVVVTCNEQQAELINPDDTFLLTTTTLAGIRSEVASLCVHQPVNDKRSVFLRVVNAIDEQAVTTLVNLVIAKQATREVLEQYRVELVGSTGVEPAHLQTAADTLELLIMNGIPTEGAQ